MAAEPLGGAVAKITVSAQDAVDAGRDANTERARLMEFLSAAGLDAPIVDYPAHTTVEEGKQLRGDLPGVFTKNLLLKDKKGALFFVTAHEDTNVELKTLHTKVGAHGRLGFASPDRMAELLHVTPGTATPLALFNDTGGAVTLVADHALEGAEQVNFHPMVHTESIGLTWTQFTLFARACGHVPLIVDPGGC